MTTVKFDRCGYRPSSDEERLQQEVARNVNRLRQYRKRLDSAPGYLLQSARLQRLHHRVSCVLDQAGYADFEEVRHVNG